MSKQTYTYTVKGLYKFYHDLVDIIFLLYGFGKEQIKDQELIDRIVKLKDFSGKRLIEKSAQSLVCEIPFDTLRRQDLISIEDFITAYFLFDTKPGINVGIAIYEERKKRKVFPSFESSYVWNSGVVKPEVFNKDTNSWATLSIFLVDDEHVEAEHTTFGRGFGHMYKVTLRRDEEFWCKEVKCVGFIN
jgi:hypothetical protein